MNAINEQMSLSVTDVEDDDIVIGQCTQKFRVQALNQTAQEPNLFSKTDKTHFCRPAERTRSYFQIKVLQ